MRIASTLLIVALVTSIVMLIKEFIDAKKENRKVNPIRIGVYGTIIGCASVVIVVFLFLLLITLAIVVNM
jgi:hypothetical protein